MFRKITIIAAALATSATLGMTAVPANAISRGGYETTGDMPTTTRTLDTQSETPTDENGMRYCELKNALGGSVYVKHGEIITVTVKWSDGTQATLKYKCVDGSFVPVDSRPSATGYHYNADNAYVDASDSLVLVNPQKEYAYSAEGATYATP